MSGERDLVLEAAWRLDAGYPAEALEVLRGVDVWDARAHHVRGSALLALHRDAEAEETARLALANDPENLGLLELLARAQLVSDPNAAEVTVRRAIGLAPDLARLFGLYVAILLRQGRYEWAEKMLDRMTSIAPDSEETTRVRSMFMLQAASSANAHKAAFDHLRSYPDDAFAHYVRGISLLGRTAWWRGLAHLDQAAALRPQDPMLVETARVMRSWYLWPFHVTGGIVHYTLYGLLLAATLVLFARDDSRGWYCLLATFAVVGLKLLAIWTANQTIQRRVTRALQQQ